VTEAPSQKNQARYSNDKGGDEIARIV